MAGTTGYLESAQRAGAGDIGHGVDLGKASAGGSRGPSETTENGSGQWRSRALPRGCQNHHGRAKGLSSGHSHLGILLGENPLYLALGNHH